ncbi:MAG: endo alpha-1,4 polygalactosaminidase [Lachnospiraceae bacterium]|nr:endo alpha-1,4 polygalactosaminidase [Lachnospiraceae bacterium]
MKKQGYDILVIDAQYYSEEQIAKLHAEGKTVYSYINVGSIENFRPYYDDYVDLTIAKYEHWDEERWIDVSSREWQDFLLNRLAPEILGKGVDGLFVDNTDVYYIRHTEEIYNGLTDILHGFKSLDTYVSINGGDSYVYEYLDRGGEFREIADAVNQETVFSKIEWDGNRFSKNDAGEREYFQEYIEKVSASGGDIFLLEYTTDPELIDAIREYTEAHGFRYYASSTLELR